MQALLTLFVAVSVFHDCVKALAHRTSSAVIMLKGRIRMDGETESIRHGGGAVLVLLTV